MAVGQAVLSTPSGGARRRTLEDRLGRSSADAARVHAQLLQDLAAYQEQDARDGLSLSTVPQVALLLRCGEARAARWLSEACCLTELPQGLEALQWGLLTVEQCGVVAAQLAPLELPMRLRIWQRLLARLRSDLEQGSVLVPARLTTLLQTWVAEAAPADATERRQQGEQDRRVDYRRNDNGLADVFLNGLNGPDAPAILLRIADRARPFGVDDERTADQRRLDAARDLLLGRDVFPSPCGAGCGCLAGTPVPCGADVQVLVTLGGALGVTDEVAQLARHGPIEPDLLQALLHNAPRLRAVFTDGHGIPVAVSDTVLTPARGDARAVRQALLDLARMTPGRLYPRHPDDHERPSAATAPGPPATAEPAKTLEAPARLTRPILPIAQGHPPGTPGRYVVGRRLRRLIDVRAPRCEFPGCGARAVRCDAEHDRAWPQGPTCACNLGPCCRRHHRVKQEGWIKTRGRYGEVRWTHPGGRTWTSAAQHTPPMSPRRPLSPIPMTPNPLDELSPLQQQELLRELADHPDDLAGLELRATDQDLPDSDRTGDGLRNREQWGLGLADPYAWHPQPPLLDPDE